MSYKEGCLYVFGLRSVAYLTCETSQQNADIHKKKKKKRWEHNGNLKPEQTKTVSWITITLKNGQRKELQSKALISMYFLSLPVKNLRRVWGPIRSLKTRSRKRNEDVSTGRWNADFCAWTASYSDQDLVLNEAISLPLYMSIFKVLVQEFCVIYHNQITRIVASKVFKQAFSKHGCYNAPCLSRRKQFLSNMLVSFLRILMRFHRRILMRRILQWPIMVKVKYYPAIIVFDQPFLSPGNDCSLMSKTYALLASSSWSDPRPLYLQWLDIREHQKVHLRQTVSHGVLSWYFQWHA